LGEYRYWEEQRIVGRFDLVKGKHDPKAGVVQKGDCGL